MAPHDDKARSLRQHGCLNPHPDRVRDPLFGTHPFFDPRDLVQVKYEMLRRVLKEGLSVQDSARTFGFSRPTWYQAARNFESGGLSALVPDRPGPRRAHKLGNAVVAALIEARQHQPAITTGKLVALVQDRFGLTVHRRSIERALARVKKNR